MPINGEIDHFRNNLLAWFKDNQRHFPWREKNVSNYELIISEILLQRTKAETVAKYYNAFFGKYPNWQKLILATDEELEETLRPLGLYIHRAARIRKIIDEYKEKNGILPRNKDELQESSFASLYVSNAYELFVLKHRAPLLDVNMSRLLRRFFYTPNVSDLRIDKEIQSLAHSVIDTNDCKELNWAILDFAALVCKSQKPSCRCCVLNHECCYYELVEERISENNMIEMDISDEQKVNPLKSLTLLSLFSGCGGMDLGFEGDFIVNEASINQKINPDFIVESYSNHYVRLNATKFRTIFANDIMPKAKEAWVNYFSKRGYRDDIYHTESIVDLVKTHKQEGSVFPEKVDVVTGGFPCQDFSLAGKRNGFHSYKDHHGNKVVDGVPSIETRGQLYMWMREVVEITKPNMFIAENVKGLVNLANVKEIIQHDFSTIGDNGYLVLNPVVLQAANYGVPQSRERVIFIGIKKSALRADIFEALSKNRIKDSLNPYPKATHAYTVTGKNLKEPVTLQTIFRDLPEPELSADLSHRYYSQAKFMGKHCQGQSEINLSSIGPTIRSEHHGNIEFRRLSADNGGKYTEELDVLHYAERRLTPRECALIQTFPPDYEFVIRDNRHFIVSPSSAYKIIGNAVPPLLAYHIAKRIESLWDTYFS